MLSVSQRDGSRLFATFRLTGIFSVHACSFCVFFMCDFSCTRVGYA